MQDYRILPVGDTALTVEFGDDKISAELNARVSDLRDLLVKYPIRGVVDIVPTFRALTVFYDPCVISYRRLYNKVNVHAMRAKSGAIRESTVYLIPVCYGGRFGEDIESVCEHSGLPPEEVIRRHTQPDYLIYMLGFMPGFAYLGGLAPELVTPRLISPRTSIPAGSVGIGGAQTGIYPLESPGGWRIIGRTPVRPYDKNRQQPILYSAGDYIRFCPISEEEYHSIRAEIRAGTYECRTEKKVSV